MSYHPVGRRGTVRCLASALALLGCMYAISCADDSAVSTSAPSTASSGWLHWRNGDRIGGAVAGYDGNVLQFQAKPFTTPLVIMPSFLESVRFQPSATQDATANHVRVELVNGDVLFGQLKALDKDSVTIESARHGSVVLQTGAIVRLTQSSPASVLFDSDGRLEGWDTRESLRGSWVEEPGVGLVTDRFGSELFRPVKFPNTVEVVVELEWEETPGFAVTLVDETTPAGTVGLFNQLAKGLGLSTPRASRSRRSSSQNQPVFQLVVWGNTLVLETRSDFMPIVDIPKDKKKLQIRAFWNRSEGTLTVLTDVDGQTVTGDVPVAAGNWTTGIGIKNYSRSLVVAAVRASKWDGRKPTPGGSSDVALVGIDGRGFSARPTSLNSQNGKVTLDDGTVLDMKQVAEIRWAKRVPVDREQLTALDRVKYADGAVVHGKLQSIHDDVAVFECEYASEPIECRFDRRISALEFADAERKTKPTKLPFVLRTTDGQLQGRLAPITTDSQFRLGWQAAGASQAAVIDSGQNLEIERVGKEPLPKTLMISDVSETDSLFLKTRDIIPARVLAYDDGKLAVRIPGGKQGEVDESLIRAVGFAREGLSADLVQSDAWKEKGNRPDDVKRVENRIEFYRQGASIWHPNALQIPKVAFRTRHSRSNYMQVIVYLFANDAERPRNALRLGLYASGREFYYFFGFEENVGYNQLPVSTGATIDWEVSIDGKNAVLRVGGEEIARESIPNNAEVGKGIRFEVQGGSSSGSRSPLLTVSNLRLPNFGDPFQVITAKDKQIVLQIPRRYRLRLPTHLLLARTGDVLRGQLKSMDEEAVQFVVRTAPQRIPRSRLAGVLWFDKPVDPAQEDGDGDGDEPSPATNETPQGSIRVTTASSRITLVPTGIEDDQLVGESPVVGPIRVGVSEILLWELGGSRRPVGEAAFADWQPKVAADPVEESQ